MKLNEIKGSMLYTSCEYEYEAQSLTNLEKINAGDMIFPEEDVLRFYAGAQVMGIVEDKYGVDAELPPNVAKIVTAQHKSMVEVFKRIYTYVLLISVSESRHAKLHDSWGHIESTYGIDVLDLATDIQGNTRSSSRNTFLAKKRNVRKITEYLDWNMIEGFTHTSSYGGKPWFNISNRITKIHNGEISPHTMVDVAWALVHNNGTIFNKGTIYNNEYSTGNLVDLLDLQRGGAILSFIKHGKAEYPMMKVQAGYLGKLKKELATVYKEFKKETTHTVTPTEIHEAGAIGGVFSKNQYKTKEANEPDTGSQFSPNYSGEAINLGIGNFYPSTRI